MSVIAYQLNDKGRLALKSWCAQLCHPGMRSTALHATAEMLHSRQHGAVLTINPNFTQSGLAENIPLLSAWFDRSPT